MNRITAVFSIVLAMFARAGISAQTGHETRQANTLTLGEAVRMALSRSPEILIAIAQAAQAAESVRETKSLNRPQAVVGSGLAYNNGFPLSIEGSAPSIVQLGFSQSIFSKKNKNLILESEQSSLAGRIGADSARNEVAARVALVYSELFRARQAGVFWTERIASLEKEREVIASQLEAGRLRPLDMSLSRAALAGARQELLSFQERIGLAEVELRQLTGIPGGTAIEVVEPELSEDSPDAPAEELYRRAAEIHPEIRQASAALQARKLHVESVRGEKYPELQLVSQYALFSRTNNYQDYFNTFTRNNFLVGLSVQFPILTGSRTEAQISRSMHEAEAARLQLERLKESLRLNIERTCSGFRMAKSAVEVAHEAADAAGESLGIEESLLEAGRIGFREVQSARSQLAEKRLGELQAAKNLFDRKIELLRLTGVSAQVLGK